MKGLVTELSLVSKLPRKVIPKDLAATSGRHLSRTMAEVGRYHSIPSGHDEDYVNPPDEDFQCIICQLPSKEPVLTSCGHRFCKQCLEEYLRRSFAESRRISAFKTVSKHLILRFFLVICVRVVHCARTTWFYKCTAELQGHERVVHDQHSYRGYRGQ